MYRRAASPITAVVAMGLAWISVLIFHQKVQFLDSSFLREKNGLVDIPDLLVMAV
jgi:hypothetical protein